MREEHVTLSNIEVSDLYDTIKTHLQEDPKLDISMKTNLRIIGA